MCWFINGSWFSSIWKKNCQDLSKLPIDIVPVIGEYLLENDNKFKLLKDLDSKDIRFLVVMHHHFYPVTQNSVILYLNYKNVTKW